MSFTSSQMLALELTSIVCSALSFVCCLFICVSWIIFKQLRILAYSLVFCTAFSTLFRSFFKMFPVYPTGSVICTLQGFSITFGGMGQCLWISTIAIIMYKLTFDDKIRETSKHRQWVIFRRLVCANFGIQLIFGLIPVFTKSYVDIGPWCWIDNNDTLDHVLRWTLYYTWNVVSVVLCLVIYCKLYGYFKKVHDTENTGSDDRIAKAGNMYSRIKYYPLALIIGYGIPTVNRFIDIFTDTPYVLALIMSITTGLFGVILFIIYGKATHLISLYKEVYLKDRSHVDDDASASDDVEAKAPTDTVLNNLTNTNDDEGL